jgi:uncharacterized protein YndB with AHSA1/START domain
MTATPPDVTTAVDRDTVSATAVVNASPERIFEYLRRPANHPELSGDGSVRGTTVGPEVLAAGDRFGMKMHIKLPYRVTSKVVEYEEGRRIAWCHFNGHRWRWQLEPAGEGRTTVTETFDLSTARIPAVLRLAGLPRKHKGNVAKSVRNLAAHFDA